MISFSGGGRKQKGEQSAHGGGRNRNSRGTVESCVVTDGEARGFLCHRHSQSLSEQTSLLVATAKGEGQVLREKCRVCQAVFTAGGFKKIKYKKTKIIEG